MSAQAQLFWKLDNSTGTWTSTNWGTDAAGPFGSGWTAGSNAVFNANSTITYVTNTNVGNITVADGVTVNVTTAGTFDTGGNVRTITVGTGASFTMAGQALSTTAGTGFIKNGAGTWDMGSNANLYNGGFTLNSGTVIVSGNNNFGNGILTINGGTIQSSGARTFAATSLVIGGDFAITGTGGWTMNMPVSLGGAVRTINMTATGTKTWNGIISGVGGGLTFTGSGSGNHVFTNAANSFSGAIEVNGLEVEFQNAGSLGTGNSITVDGGRIAFRNTFTIDSSKNFFVGDGADTGISTPGGGTVITYNGVIANKTGETGSWAKQGGGILILGGASTYTGNTFINNGTVRLADGNNRLPTGTVLSLGQAASANLGVLDLNGRNQEIAGLSSTAGTNATVNKNTVTSAAAAILTINATGNHSYGAATAANSGIITGAVSLVKTGAGTQTLGDVNTYTGTTSITAGTLSIASTGSINTTSGLTLNGTTAEFNYNGTAAYSGGPITLTQGTLSGTGAIGVAVTVGAGATLAPGNSPGIQSYNSGLTWANGGTYEWELKDWNSATAGTDFDQIQVSGANLDISSLTMGTWPTETFRIDIVGLNASDLIGSVSGFNAATDRSWTIATTPGITGTFSADLFTLDTTNFALNNPLAGGNFSIGLAGNDVVLSFTAAPIPVPIYWDSITAGVGGTGNWTASSATFSSTAAGSDPDVRADGNNIKFSGTAGTVTLTGALVANGGIDFETDGYNLTGGTSLTLGGAATITTNPGVSATINSVLSGNAGLVKTGGGTLILNGNNNLTGVVSITGGTLQTGSTSALGSSTNTLGIGGNGTLDLNGQNITAGQFTGLAGSLVTNSSANAASLTVGSSGASTFAGTIQNGNAPLSLNIQNQGTTGVSTISSANTFSGSTTLGSGFLSLTHVNALQNTSGVTVANGSQLQLNVSGAGPHTYALGSGVLSLSGAGPAGAANEGALIIGTGVTNGNTHVIGNNVNLTADTTINARGGTNTLTLSGNISGPGGLTKIGGGNLILGGTNTFAGAAAVNNGTVTLSNLGALSGASSVSVASGATLQLNLTGTNVWQLGAGNIILNNGGTLRQFSGLEDDIAIITQTIQLTGTGGTLNAPGDSRIYAQGDITGSGALTKAGGGELRFTGTAKTYTGDTNINNGRIRIDSTGVPIATTAFNLNGGNLRFGQPGNFTFSLGAGGNAPINIIGTSSIEHADIGHVTLTNPVSITGTGNFRSREVGALLEFTGPITGIGALLINQGTGGNPVQAGTIFLSGNASAFSGNIDVLQSVLRLGTTTALGANVFSLAAPATLMIDITSPSQLGSIAATSATLANGSVIMPNFTSGPAGGITSYDLITTTGGVTDNGATVQSTALMQLSLDLSNPNILRLIADVDYAGFGVFGFNDIQTAVANYLSAPGVGTALSAMRAGALNATTDEEITAFYDAIAGEEYGGMMNSALFQAQDQLRSITRFAPHVQNRLGLRDSLGVRPLTPGTIPADENGPIDSSWESGWNVFSDLKVQRGNQARTDQMGGYNANGQTFIAGADRVFAENIAGGFFGTYEHGRTEFDQRRGWADADTLSVGAMASLLLPRGHITAGAQYLDHSFEVERYSPIGTARGKPDGDQVALILQGATQLGTGRLSIIPTAQLQYNRLSIDGFSESGAPIAQTFDGMSYDSLQGGLGVRLGYTIPGHTVVLRPEVFAEYRHDFLDGAHRIGSNFLDGTGPLNIVTPGRSPGYAVVGGGLHAEFSNNASTFIQYEAQLIDTDTTTYGIYAGFRWNFDDSLLNYSSLAFDESPRPYRDTLRGTALGEAFDFINLRALVMLQYDHGETASTGGTEADPDDPADTDFWFARRIRLSADRDLGWGFNLGGAFQFTEELNSSENAVELFEANLGWDLFEPFSLYAGLDKVPLGWEETTSSARLKTIERSVATRSLGRLGGDEIGRSHWRAAAKGTLPELYTNPNGPINRYDFHYEFAVANPREANNAPWSNDPSGQSERWPDPSYYLRIHNELRTAIGTFDFGADFADIPTFRARSEDEITGATAFSPFLNYNRGWFNLTATGAYATYDRDPANGGLHREADGFTLTPSIFITPQVELVGMYSQFDTDGDEAIRLNQASSNLPTSYPDSRRFDHIDQFYFGVNHYLNGDDLKVMYGVEHTRADEAGPSRPVSAEDAWAFRVRVQLRL